MTPGLHFFLHIPKTAGTTLNDILRANYAQEAVLDVYDSAGYRKIREMTQKDLDTLQLIQGHMFVHDFEQLFSSNNHFKAVTFLRDPVARVVSEYRFLKAWPGQHLYQLMNEEQIGLEEFVTTNRPQLKNHGKNLMVKSLCGVRGKDSNEAMLERAWSNLSQRFACFGLVEKFDHSLLLLKQALGLESIFYDRRNVNPDQLTPADLPETTMEIIKEHNQLDIELLDRAAALLNLRIVKQGPTFQAELKTFRMVNERYQRIAKKLLEGSSENFKDRTQDD